MQGRPVNSAFYLYMPWYLEAYLWAEITSGLDKKEKGKINLWQFRALDLRRDTQQGTNIAPGQAVSNSNY